MTNAITSTQNWLPKVAVAMQTISLTFLVLNALLTFVLNVP